jgi:hypothetical protein
MPVGGDELLPQTPRRIKVEFELLAGINIVMRRCAD